MKSVAIVFTDLEEIQRIEFLIAFIKTKKEIENLVRSIDRKLIGDAIFWICYPKASSKKYSCDFNRDTGFEILGAFDFEGVRQVAIDEDWSALRFRKVHYIKKITRKESFALTKEAKERTSQKGN
ncbi:MAG: hypothetical protein NBV61_00575 [Algoriphagus sp.]|nr:hypothetical protein [Algoriphagus sp.]